MASIYAGRINNSGAQIVKAPMQHTQSKRGTVHTGRDLRSGGGGQPYPVQEKRTSKAGK